MAQLINEVKRFQKIAGILKENTDLEDLRNKPGFDQLMAYLEKHPEEVKKLELAADEMQQAGIQEALDKNKIIGYLTNVGIGSALGALLGSILAGVADPAHALDAIAAGVAYAGGGTALLGLPGKGGFSKDKGK